MSDRESVSGRLLLWGVGTSRTLRAHWMLAELDLPYERRPITSRSGETLTPDYTRLNPSQKIPTLQDGEFVLTEQRPRMQSRPEVIPLAQGDAVVFAVHHRPVQGSRGFYRVNMRHGVSTVRSGQRHTLGVIFHDAQ